MNEVQQQFCKGEDCNKPAKLQCPTCLKAKISGSYFCSQDCFKKNWSTHKSIHQTIPKVPEKYIKDFVYTGTLRAIYPLSPRSRSTTTIAVLNNEEIEAMRILAREVLDIGAAAVRPGITTDEIDRIIHEATIERNSYPSPLNYYEFPKSVCTSVNEVICHGIPDQRELEDGDIVNLDVSLYYNGFHADLNETYPVGTIDQESQKLIKTARECLYKAIECVKPNFPYRDLGAVIEKTAKANNCSVVKTYSGHGIHSVPHYTKNKAVGKMKPGHVFTIEPMINLGTFRDHHWNDKWTAVTEDGKRSAQFEHTLLVTETGVEILTAGKNEML
ncbi:2776_t:CDS:10 [Entrophospora sp. SA101]|nr:2776_t:CDS:10 [Entrophospora sp. SA101]